MTRPEAIKYIESKLGRSMEKLRVFPMYLLIEPVNICNARCIMCGIDFDKKEKKSLENSLFDKIVEETSEYREYIEKVMLYFNCEPLLDRALHHKIKSLKDAGIKTVNIASNMSVLDAKRAEEIIEAGLDEIYITIDSMKKTTYEEIRRRLNFEKVYRNTLDFIRIRNAVNPKLTIRVQMVYQEKNKGEKEDFVRQWKRELKTGDQVVVHMAHNWGKKANVLHFQGDERINDIPCITLWGHACIHADGSMALCSVDTVEGSEHSLGDVHMESVAEKWNGVRLNKIREMHLEGARKQHPLCNGCNAWRETKNLVQLTL